MNTFNLLPNAMYFTSTGVSADPPPRFASAGIDLQSNHAPDVEDAVRAYLTGVVESQGKPGAVSDIWVAAKLGGGKTSMGIAITRYLSEKGLTAGYITLPDLVRILGEEFSEGQADLVERMVEMDFLFIDDFDDLSGNDEAAAMAFRVIDGRWGAFKPTGFAAAYPYQYMIYRQFDGPLMNRIMSRIRGIEVSWGVYGSQ